MSKWRTPLILASALTVLPGLGVSATAQMADKTPAARLDAMINPVEMGEWLKTMSSEPNHVSSPHDKANAEFMLDRFKAWGWDAHIETFEVLYPTPVSETLELLGDTPFRATLQEPAIAEDSTSGNTAHALPSWVAYGGDGDVTAPLVYVNYGMPEDYLTLERLGISVKGKIVIARYGRGWRGLKPKLAQDHGALGCIIYSDPRDDGYTQDDVYPKGPARPAFAFQRGSVMDMPIYPGDPLTPGIGATRDAKRLSLAEARTLLKIPVLPISYGDAQVFLSALDGPVAPNGWQGGLPMTYHVGQSRVPVHLATKADWSLKTAYDVVAMIKGSTLPDQWVLRGNHHDGWVFGASDPLSGNIALMAEAKAIGSLVKSGWKPKRTLVYLSWDAEEPALLGSTEWAETHAEELQKKAVIYINSDSNGRGFLNAGGSHAYQHLVNQVAADVTDPETGVSVGERLKARVAVEAHEGGRGRARAAGEEFALDPLGSGSDYSAFLQHLGISSLDIGYGGEGNSGGVYHSVYDSYDHHRRFVDPGFVYDALLAKTVGRLVINLGDAPVLPQRFGDLADTVASYRDEVKALADSRRDAQVEQARLLASHAYALSSDPAKPLAPPVADQAVPYIEFAALDNAVAHLQRAARTFDAACKTACGSLSEARAGALSAALIDIEQSLLIEDGLPGRPWFRHAIYAPGRLTGYGAKTLPGIREAIEDKRWADADLYSSLTAKAIEAYAARLDQALKRLPTP